MNAVPSTPDEVKDAVPAIVAEIPARARMVFCLAHVEGKTNAEIAEMMHIPLALVQRLNERANLFVLTRLREQGIS